MVCSCAMSSNCCWLQIIFYSRVKGTTLFSFLRSLLRENGRSLRFPRKFIKNKLGDRMIKQLLNSVIAKYRDLSLSYRSIICLSLLLRQITDLLATDKSQCFADPRTRTVNCCKPTREPRILTLKYVQYYMLMRFMLDMIDINHKVSPSVRACLHGVGDPGLVGLVSFVFTLWGTQNKRNLPH